MDTSQLARWLVWCEGNGLDPLVGIQRAHVALYIRHLGDSGLMDSPIVTMMHGVRGYFRFAHIDGPIYADPPCTPACRRCGATSRAPRAWTAWS